MISPTLDVYINMRAMTCVANACESTLTIVPTRYDDNWLIGAAFGHAWVAILLPNLVPTMGLSVGWRFGCALKHNPDWRTRS